MIVLQEIEEELSEIVNASTDYTKFLKELDVKKIVDIGLETQFLGGIYLGIQLGHKARKMDPIQAELEKIRVKIRKLKKLLKIDE